MNGPEKVGEFEVVYNRYKSGVYDFCRRMLNDGDEAKDVVQEVFIRFYQNSGRIDGDASVKVWLFKSARNRCLNVIRNNSKLSRTGSGEEDLAQPDPADPDRHDESAVIASLLDRLTPDYREVLILREWDELSYDEIARTLDLTVSAVKSKLFKARRQAAAVYRKLYGD